MRDVILTGSEIAFERERGAITIEPFSQKQLNPNSYNYRLGDQIVAVTSNNELESGESATTIDETGHMLRPGHLYLSTTQELLGSDTYAMSLIGRSSIGRVGLFVQVSANLGHVGSCHRWTLELVASLPILVFPGMLIGQISFWQTVGLSTRQGSDMYSSLNHPARSRHESHLL